MSDDEDSLEIFERAEETCPYLGLEDDPATCFRFPTQENLCFAGKNAVMIDEDYQASICLDGQYPSCPRFDPSKVPQNIESWELDVAYTDNPRRPVWLLVVIAVLILAGLGSFAAYRTGLFSINRAVAGQDGGEPTDLTPETPPNQAGAGPAILPPAASLTPSSTPFPVPTLTPTMLPSPTATQQGKNTPTFTATSTPTNTATPSPTPSPTNTAVVCWPPSDWVSYTVQTGDTLASLSKNLGTTIDRLWRGNCLAYARPLVAGEQIYLPSLPGARPKKPPSSRPTATDSPNIPPVP